MSIAIPLRNDLALYDFQVDLDGATYGFVFRWNEPVSAWYMDLLAADDSPILSGLRVVVGWPVGHRYRDPRLPPGTLLFIDTTGQEQDVLVQGDLGGRVTLSYFGATEAAP